MKKKMLYVAVLGILLPFFAGVNSLVASARVMNVETRGSLTIHKFLNPDTIPWEDGGPGFQGNGTTNKPLEGSQGTTGDMKPLPNTEFSVFGRLTTAELDQLLATGVEYDPLDPKPLDPRKVEAFIQGKTAAYKGVTNASGQVTFSNIPINTVDLANNLYLVVETKLPISDTANTPIVQQASMPVLVNIPSINPEEDGPGGEVNNYLYDVNLFMKNYRSDEPEIGKVIDKPTHSVGEEVKYTLTISNLAFDIDLFELLEVTDVLDKRLDFFELGTVTFENSDGTVITTFQQGVDYTVTTPAKGTNGTLHWAFTSVGISKLTGITAGDGKTIKIRHTALTNALAKPNEPIENDASLDYVNRWGYGTKPPKDDPNKPWKPNEPITPPKPSEVVNTIWGERTFIKVDKQNNALKLEGAEFLVRNRSTRPISAFNENGEMVTHPAGTTLYAIIKNNRVTGWTVNNRLAFDNGWTITSGVDGKFYVDGLAYSNDFTYRKQYIFAVMKTETINGTEHQVVGHYEYVTAAKRTADTTQATITAEINGILSAHPGTASGDGAWKFYKESEADGVRLGSYAPADMIDFFGEQWNDYELIEVRAPHGYAPIEKNPQDVDEGTTEEDPYEHPFKFTVPGFADTGLPNYDRDATEITVPNAKIPAVPLTGGVGTITVIVLGLAIIGTAVLMQKRGEDNTTKESMK